MKSFILCIALMLSVGYAVAADKEEPKVKKVCHDQVGKDGKPVLGKDGKPKQTCKDVKIHKKLEGHDVPPKK
jgi:hypothetical protein